MGNDPRLVTRVAARFMRATEFPSQEALKEYLHEHPGADPSNHSVKKPGEEKSESGGGEGKKEEPKKPAKERAKELRPKIDAVYDDLKKAKNDFQNPYGKDGKSKSDETKKGEAHDIFKKVAPKLKGAFDEIDSMLKELPEGKASKYVQDTIAKAKSAVENVSAWAEDPAKAAEGHKESYGAKDSAKNHVEHAKHDIEDAHNKVNNALSALRDVI
jgi:hypothetical protein